MSDGFAAAAVRLCGAASALLGWRPGEFWDSTPAELAIAFNLIGTVADPPEFDVIEELKRRFPDDQGNE